MKSCNHFVMLLTATSAVAYTINHNTFLIRDLADNSYVQAIQVRDPDDLVLAIHRRGLRLSKTGNSAPQQTTGKPVSVSAPKTEKPLQYGPSRTPGPIRIPPEIQNAEKKTLDSSLGPGRITRRPQILQSPRPASFTTPRMYAGGGTIGHSRIPPRVPKEHSRLGPMQIPPSPAEEKSNKSQLANKNNQSQDTGQKGPGYYSKEHKSWDPREEQGSWVSRGRPPALTSIDDF